MISSRGAVALGDDARAQALADMPVCTRIVQVDDLPISLDDKWRACSAVLAPRAVRAVAADSRWQVRYALAEIASVPVGVIGLYRRTGQKFPAEILDPALKAAEVFSSPLPADSYLLIGGSADMVAGSAVSSEIDAETAEAVRAALVDAGFRWAEDRGLTAAAMYVRDSELEAYSGPATEPRRLQRIGELATLLIPAGGWDAYMESLSHKKRATVFRDIRAAAAKGLISERADPGGLIKEAGPLIMAVRARHRLPDHELLVEYRMSEWIANCAGVPLAFTARDRAGKLLGACFGCWWHDVLELTEVGLVDDHDARHLAYTEIMIYEPVRFAAQNGCTRIELGLESIHPKTVRGAATSNVWAVGGPAVGRAG